MNAMTASSDAPYSKADIEHLVRDLVPPIVETAVDRAMSRVQATLATDIAKGVAQALNEQNAKLGIDTTSSAGIREAQHRAFYIDQWIKSWPDVQRRWNDIDEALRDFTSEDRMWVRDTRRRSEQTSRTVKENVIRWGIGAMGAALMALLAVWWTEDRHNPPTSTLPVIEADRGRVVVQPPTATP
jgi:hypothetical protein